MEKDGKIDRDNLKRLMRQLQCYSCKVVPTPNFSDRYCCIEEHHLLCEKCKSKCFCGSGVVKKPSKLVKELLIQCPWTCIYFTNGCGEFEISTEVLGRHQSNCVFREVVCPDLGCYERITYKDVFAHLQTRHEAIKIGPEKLRSFNIRLGASTISNGDFWHPTLLEISSNKYLILNGMAKENHVMFWVFYPGPSEECMDFTCTFRLANDASEHMFKGPLYPLDEENKSIVDSQPIFSLKTSTLKMFLDEDNGFILKLTLQKDKIEGKDEKIESGVLEFSN